MSSMRTVGDAPSVSGVSNLNRTLSAPASPDGRGKLNGRQLPPDPSAEPVSATTMEYVSPPSIDARTRSAFCGKDRKSTRLNSSHVAISYAVFCLKKTKNNEVMQQ